MKVLSGILVAAFAVFLTGLAVLIAIKPQLAERFLQSFASSPRAHYTEQSLRLIVGGAMAIVAPSMWIPYLFKLLGWMIVVTAIALLVLPPFGSLDLRQPDVARRLGHAEGNRVSAQGRPRGARLPAGHGVGHLPDGTAATSKGAPTGCVVIGCSRCSHRQRNPSRSDIK